MKVEEIKIDYRGFEINYNEEYERWKCEINPNKWFEKQTLKECKKSIDGFLKRETDFQRIDVYRTVGWGSERFLKVTITSITEEGEVWIREEKGERSKVERKYLLKINDNNTSLIEKYKEQDKIIKAATKEQENLIEQFDKF
jgi:hypothetical protein